MQLYMAYCLTPQQSFSGEGQAPTSSSSLGKGNSPHPQGYSSPHPQESHSPHPGSLPCGRSKDYAYVSGRSQGESVTGFGMGQFPPTFHEDLIGAPPSQRVIEASGFHQVHCTVYKGLCPAKTGEIFQERLRCVALDGNTPTIFPELWTAPPTHRRPRGRVLPIHKKPFQKEPFPWLTLTAGRQAEAGEGES